jgi:hypothetical protein
MLGTPVTAVLVRDDWTGRFTAVVRCEPLGSSARVTCNQRCLANPSPDMLADAA